MAKTMLLNGCSYTHTWNPTEWFANYDITNIAVPGSSNPGIIRRTVDWVIENPKPDFVIIPLTFATRIEFITHGEESYTTLNANNKDATSRAAEYFRAHLDPFQELDQYLKDVILLTSFLQNKKIPHLIFNMSETWPVCDTYSPRVESKRRYLENCPYVLDLFGFNGNTYLADSGATWDTPAETDMPPWLRHYAKSDFYILENYLDTYRKKIENL